jgi:hypothetical protein
MRPDRSVDAEDIAVLTEGYIEAVDELVGGQE